jgi:hypothetical protein
VGIPEETANWYPPSRRNELELVFNWRLKQLLDAGYPLELAEALADSKADLHAAVELIVGCGAEIAARILL